MLSLILAEAELERIPDNILHHPIIIAFARKQEKKPEQTLLDSNYHHTAMYVLDNGDRRGRPDIIHLFLLTALESIVNKQGLLNIIIHTRNNEAIYVARETRIMRNYERFVGLIEKLFEKNAVPDKDKPLLQLKHNQSLQQIVDETKPDVVLAFSKQGTRVNLQDYFAKLKKSSTPRITCIIGGFPRGTFHSDISTIAHDVVSIYGDMLSAWTMASEILVNYENTFL